MFLKNNFRLVFLLALGVSCQQPKNNTDLPVTVFEQSGGMESPTYEENIAFWKQLSQYSNKTKLWEVGKSDAGYPIHLVTWNLDENISDWKKVHETSKSVLFINNGIHPGEPDGIDACQLLLKEIAVNPSLQKKYKNLVIALIPVYNVGGALLRNSHSRANQNGPKSYGFRGNAQNLDLNRDCIKMDSKNAAVLAQLFHFLDPDLFIDTHVSNGADYQHVVTLLSTQEQKLGGPLEPMVKNSLTPFLYSEMEKDSFPMIPYVNVWGRAPQNGGIEQFMDWPRYANGYATLHHTPSFTIETHMLKPFAKRVKGTQKILENCVEYLVENGQNLQDKRKEQKQFYAQKSELDYHWEIDKTKADTVYFKGFAYEEQASEVDSTLNLFTYNRKQPKDFFIPYYNVYQATKSAKKPSYYVVERGYENVIEKLKLHGVVVEKAKEEKQTEALVTRIKNFETVANPYEKHYLHYNVVVEEKNEPIVVQPGDFIIKTGSDKDRIIFETLQADAADSYFAWNAFDAILQQKEGFSPYVWDAKAAEILSNNLDLRKEFEKALISDIGLHENLFAQQNWIYQYSKYYENRHMKYPVYKVFP